MSTLHITHRVIVAQEAAEDGDLPYVREILRDLVADLIGSPERCHVCECGARFEWPGQLESHRFEAHSWKLAA